MYFLMHLNLQKKSIFFTRHGESLYNLEGRIGGNAPLTDAGKKYANALADWICLQPEFTQTDDDGFSWNTIYICICFFFLLCTVFVCFF